MRLNTTISLDELSLEGSIVLWWDMWFTGVSASIPNTLLTWLVAYYKHDAVGSFPSEVNSPTNDLTITGASFDSSWKIVAAYSFNGTNNRIEANISFSITTSPYSISSWIYLDNTTGFQVPWFFWDKDTDDYFRLTLNTWVPELNARDPWASPQTMVRRDTWNALSTWTWHHVVWVLVDINTLNLYVNGTKITTSIIDPGRQPANMDRFSIGRSWDATPWTYFAWNTDEIWVWNIALSDDDVTALYNSWAWLAFGSFN